MRSDVVERKTRKAVKRSKAVWGGRARADDRPPAAKCPRCGASAEVVHQTASAEYLICRDCEHTWSRQR